MKRLWVVARHAFFGFRDDRCSRLAAAVSYYALFSIVPLAIFLLSIFGFVLNNASVRKDVIDQILNQLPLSEANGRTTVENTLNNVKQISGPAAVLSLLVTLWTSTTMFGALRSSLNSVFRVDEHRPFFQGKLLDIAQVGGIALFLIGSMVLTGLVKTVQSLSADRLGPLAGYTPLWDVAFILVPALVSFAAFLALYRIVPAARPTLLEALPGALIATLLFEVLKNTFAIYVANFNNYDVVYGSLAAILLFLLYMYLSSNIVLIGAEVSATVSRLERGDYAAEFAPGPPGPPLATRLLGAVKGLFVRQHQAAPAPARPSERASEPPQRR
ncbi:MAG: YihY/virulence factor BrkB family protein [Dehalococcoidia bacterium]|nr:YihY/virulence factor BrkB family protein [Dehalococcoidia bacterium]